MNRLRWRVVLAALVLASAMAPCLAERGDITMSRDKMDEGNEYPPATFPHAVHRYQYKCYACHDALFKMKKGANKVTMQDISDGKSCGACHNETIAFGSTFESCERCHR